MSDTVIVVRPAEVGDQDEWVRLRTALWPDWPDDHPVEATEYFAKRPEKQHILLAEVNGAVVGMAEMGMRDYAEECDSSPVGYLEGIYVDPDHRVHGVGKSLVEAGAAWARAQGCTEMASDREITNEASGAFHLAVGFDETIRMVCYRMSLAERDAGA